MFLIQHRLSKRYRCLSEYETVEEGAYTMFMDCVRVFSSRELAERHACPHNDEVLAIEDVLDENVDDS